MKTTARCAAALPLSWLYLAWFGLFLSTLAIGAISAAFRGDPARVVLQWGFGDFALFAIILYVIGSCVAVLILGALLRSAGLQWRDVGWQGRLSKASAFAAVVAAAVACVFYWLANTLLPSAGIPMRWHTSGSSRIVLSSGFDIALTVLFAVVIGPIVEEIVFRGYVLTALLQRWKSAVAAVLVAGIVFTSVHVWLGPGVMVFIFMWSVLPAWLYMRYKSLYPAMLFHAINNAIAYLAVPLWLN